MNRYYHSLDEILKEKIDYAVMCEGKYYLSVEGDNVIYSYEPSTKEFRQLLPAAYSYLCGHPGTKIVTDLSKLRGDLT